MASVWGRECWGVGVPVRPCLEMPEAGSTEARDELQALTCCGDGLRGSGALGQVGPHWWAGGKHHFCVPLPSNPLAPNLARRGFCYMRATTASHVAD